MNFDQSRFNSVKTGYTDSHGSFPIGGGDCGANVWVSDDKRINLLLSKSNAFSEATRLMKLGLLQISFDENVFSEDDLPVAELHLEDGTVVVSDEKKTFSVTVAAFVDRNLYGIRVRSGKPLTVRASVLNYRDKKRQIAKNDVSARGVADGDFDVWESADVVVTGFRDALSWYHYNEWSYYDYTKRNQHLTNLTREDPILNHIFGCSVAGKGFSVSGDGLCSASVTDAVLYVSADTSVTKAPADWNEKQMRDLVSSIDGYCFDCLVSANREWWTEYFNRYYLEMSGDEKAELITKGYTLQKYMLGCACRGKMPIKYNGSIFTVHQSPHYELDYDYRGWGSAYWIQNTRLIYWDLLYSGYYEGLLPYFDLVVDLMPEDLERSRVLFGHEGLLQPETFTFYGTYCDCDFGHGQENSDAPECRNHYIRWHYNGGLETSYMMLKFREYTGEKYAEYFNTKLLPYIQGILQFFREHFPKVDGKMLIEPVSALETWQDCVDDTPDIAGMLAVIRELKKLGIAPCLNEEDIPEITFSEKDGRKVVAACRKTNYPSQQNCENGELYPLFPFEIYRNDMSAEDREVWQNTFETVPNQHVHGWSQMNIWAAMLGNTDYCVKNVSENFARKEPTCFFDAYFGPNFDWTPDQCHGSSNSIAAVFMLLQSFENDVFVRPAVPENWNVRFRLPSSKGDIEYPGK